MPAREAIRGASPTAMEQYQALRALLAAVPTLGAGDAAAARTAVEHEMRSAEHFSRRSARYRLAEVVLRALGGERPDDVGG